jgi:heme A synthase
MSWWHDETVRGRCRRAAVGLFALAVVSGLNAIRHSDGTSLQILAATTAGLLVAAGLSVLWLGRRASNVADQRPKFTFDPSRYLTPRPGHEITVASLRKVRSKHRRVGLTTLTVTPFAVLTAMAAAGAPDSVAYAVIVSMVVVIVLALSMLAIDGLRINAAIDRLRGEPHSPQR